MAFLFVATVYPGATTFEYCDSQGNGDYIVDLSNTYTDPADIVKGNEVNLFVNGVVVNDTTFQTLNLTVFSAGVQLFHTNIPKRASISEGAPYELTLSVPIPNIAPSGDYIIIADI